MNTPTFKHSAIVTGASSGIGFEIALQLAQSGVPVAAIARDGARLHSLAVRHALIDPLVADLADLDAIVPLVHRIRERHRAIGCLINNAGVQCQQRFDDVDYTAAQIRQEIDVNLTAPVLLTHALLPQLRAQESACVVNLGSVLAYAPKHHAAVYSATKAGLHLFSEALRVQLQGTGVRVIEAVMPLVDTPMTQGRGRGKISAEQAARALIDGMNTGQPMVWIGKARAIRVLKRWAPGLLQRMLQRG